MQPSNIPECTKKNLTTNTNYTLKCIPRLTHGDWYFSKKQWHLVKWEVCSCGHILFQCEVRSGQRQVLTTSPSSTSDKYPKHNNEPQKSSKTPGGGGWEGRGGEPRTFGQPVIPDPSGPHHGHTTGLSHRKGGWGEAEGEATLPRSWFHADCFVVTYHSTSPRLW